MPEAEPFDINKAIDGLSKPQLEGFITNAKAYLVQPRLVINFENKEQQLTREEFQRALVNLKDLSIQKNLVKPTLKDLAPALFEREGKSWEAETPERQSAYLDFVRGNAAGRIERGRIYPDDPLVRELFNFLAEEEVESIKGKVQEKLAAAGNEQWASAWRSSLAEPAANQNIPPEIARDEELLGKYRDILQLGGQEMGGKFLEAAHRMMERYPGMDLRTAALRLIKGEW